MISKYQIEKIKARVKKERIKEKIIKELRSYEENNKRDDK